MLMDEIENYSTQDLTNSTTKLHDLRLIITRIFSKSNSPLSHILKQRRSTLTPYGLHSVKFTILAELAPTHNTTTIQYGIQVHIIDNGRVSVFLLERPHDPSIPNTHSIPTTTHRAIYLFNGLLISLFLRILWGLTMRDILFAI